MSFSIARANGTAAAHHSGRMLGSSAVIGTGLAIEIGSQFARTVVLARLLGAAEFGIVASIMALAAAVDTVSFIGIDRFLVYAREGGEPSSLAAAHALAWMRGIISAAFIALLAVPTADLLGVRPYAFSFAAVGLMPLIRGGLHLGATQMQRYGRFLPSAASESGGALLGLVTAIVLGSAVPDHTNIVWALTAQAAGSVLLSHLLCRGTAYRIAFDGARLRDALKFGLPLLGNGLALVAAYQLDRMVVGAWLGVVALGIYGLSMTLLLQPISLLLRLATTILQPGMSKAWHEDRSGAFPGHVRQLSRYVAVVAGAGALVAATLGAPALRAAFGPSYAASDVFFVLIAAVVLLRFTRGAQGVLGLAIGRTHDLMVANTAGAVALPVTIVAFYVHAGVESAVFGLLVGELASVAIAECRLRRHCGTADRVMLRCLGLAAVIPAALGAWVLLTSPGLGSRAAAAAGALAAGTGIVLFAYARNRPELTVPSLTASTQAAPPS